MFIFLWPMFSEQEWVEWEYPIVHNLDNFIIYMHIKSCLFFKFWITIKIKFVTEFKLSSCSTWSRLRPTTNILLTRAILFYFLIYNLKIQTSFNKFGENNKFRLVFFESSRLWDLLFHTNLLFSNKNEDFYFFNSYRFVQNIKSHYEITEKNF